MERGKTPWKRKRKKRITSLVGGEWQEAWAKTRSVAEGLKLGERNVPYWNAYGPTTVRGGGEQEELWRTEERDEFPVRGLCR